MKKVFLILAIGLLLTALAGCGPEYCSVSGCPKETLSGADYCPEHKCSNFSCKNKAVDSYSYCTECLDRAYE